MIAMSVAPMPSPRPAPVAKPDGILIVDDVVKRFPTPDGVITAVDHVSFAVRPGEFLSVIGPSGCGKSTLFNIIGGLVTGYEGSVTVAGERIDGPHASVGMVFQEESTFPWRTVIENVAFPLEIAGMPKAQRLEKAMHFISLVGLNGFENRHPVEQTRLLLGDKVLQIQQTLQQTTLLITHNITEAVQLSDRILVMTYRPGKTKRIVEIKLPRPRSSEIVGSDAFGHYVAQVWADLREEATRGLEEAEARARDSK
jgi:NitT/TauT family transport system ATP-binding protein